MSTPVSGPASNREDSTVLSAVLATLLAVSILAMVAAAVLAMLTEFPKGWNTLDYKVKLGLGGLVLFFAVCSVASYRLSGWDWTGIGPSGPLRRDGTQKRSGKTLWDAARLLFVPLAVASVGLWFTSQQNEADQRQIQLQHEADLQNARIRQENATLDNYLDRMSDLLLSHRLTALRGNESGPVRTIIGIRTLAAMLRLDDARNAILMQFIRSSHLFPLINFQGANLTGIKLGGTSLPGINMYNANLSRANLSHASLYEAQLISANLRDAILISTNLEYSNLSNASLPGARLSHASLFDANLNGATLTGAHLNGTNLGGAKLVGASLDGANLSGANLGGADLSRAHWNGTICPDGSRSNLNHISPQSCRGHLTP
jgi:uncharacterized protein YjbI with pentapeptide repeats